MKVKVLPFHAMHDINDNMYENVVIIAKKSKEIISKNSIDLNKMEEGFESTDEIAEQELDFDPNQKKAIVTATQDFIENKIEWNKIDRDKD
ncbi:MAG: hypothetical protein CMG11_02450 [Candidatus Marinimicrobia bacterium]|nr:hypothetical protein [Candidatus Neomarinimicrobiota bacterium]|tara:strand:- start:3886 stop:4158 length:273 start_codon:yes stop_codon:yes gene_type:complete